MRDEFERDGFVVVPGALAAGELRRLEAAVDRVWEREAGAGRAAPPARVRRARRRLLDLVDHPRCLSLVTDALGSNIYVYHCHLDVHPPEEPAEPRWRWHQDGGRQNVELDSPRPRLPVKVAYFLTGFRHCAGGSR